METISSRKQFKKLFPKWSVAIDMMTGPQLKTLAENNGFKWVPDRTKKEKKRKKKKKPDVFDLVHQDWDRVTLKEIADNYNWDNVRRDVRGGLQTFVTGPLTWGMADEAAAVVDGFYQGGRELMKTRDFGMAGEQVLKTFNARHESLNAPVREYRERHPGRSVALDSIGALPWLARVPVKPKDTSTFAKANAVGESIGRGTAYGTVTGTMMAENNPLTRIEGAMKGGLVGGVAGLGGYPAKKYTEHLLRERLRKLIKR